MRAPWAALACVNIEEGGVSTETKWFLENRTIVVETRSVFIKTDRF
jgi:hypothetical protein